MTSKRMTRRRRSEILKELTKLSRNGWAHALPIDYEPLEAELEGRKINAPGILTSDYAERIKGT